VTVSPLVAIVGMLCLLIVTLAIVSRARPEDLPKIFETFRRWFGK
jgi:hypothetical protein